MAEQSTLEGGTSPLARGKRAVVSLRSRVGVEHPRSRGENVSNDMRFPNAGGTSPLARGKRCGSLSDSRTDGNIPARAGKTVSCPASPSGTQEHPRSRGENEGVESALTFDLGTSPLARGKPHRRPEVSPLLRNIPARAGKTRCAGRPRSSTTEHPRSRGENTATGRPTLTRGGTSPLARGKRHVPAADRRTRRNIPARAGKTSLPTRAMSCPAEHPRSRGENT